jgi:hypothetical protein
MKTKGMLSMLAAAAAIVITSNAGAQAGSSQKKYTDDSIVRDLKAGKLTVREAQILQDRRDHATVKAAAATPAAAPAKTGATAKKAHAAKAVKPGKAVRKKSKAPVKQLTSPHPKHAARNAHATKAKPVAKPHHAVAVKEHPAKAVHKKDVAATKKAEPVRKTAVKYIR